MVASGDGIREWYHRMEESWEGVIKDLWWVWVKSCKKQEFLKGRSGMGLL